MTNELQIYIDGAYYPKSKAKISVYDHGFLYGDGVFEGIRVYDGFVFKLKEHVQRLYDSAHAMMLQIPITQEEMVRAVAGTVKKNQFDNSYVRLVVTRGEGDLGLDPRKCSKATIIIIADKIVLHDDEAKMKGITALISWVRRDPVDGTSHEIKSLNYLNSVMAKLEANLSGADEAICLEKNGCVAEGVGENVFIVKNSKISTPPTSTGALEGITSKAVVELAKQMGCEVKGGNIRFFMLLIAVGV